MACRKAAVTQFTPVESIGLSALDRGLKIAHGMEERQ
jgi:hypothetical protein